VAEFLEALLVLRLDLPPLERRRHLLPQLADALSARLDLGDVVVDRLGRVRAEILRPAERAMIVDDARADFPGHDAEDDRAQDQGDRAPHLRFFSCHPRVNRLPDCYWAR